VTFPHSKTATNKYLWNTFDKESHVSEWDMVLFYPFLEIGLYFLSIEDTNCT